MASHGSMPSCSTSTRSAVGANGWPGSCARPGSWGCAAAGSRAGHGQTRPASSPMTWCSAPSRPPRPTGSGSLTSPTCPPGRASSTWRSWSMPIADAWSGGPWADHLRTGLVLDALAMAVQHRRPTPGLVHHSDHGCQYTSLAFSRRCREAGIAQSMGSVGDCYDNAMAESFTATLECELIARHHWRTHTEARMAVFDFIEGFYNPRRRHSALGYLSPVEYERRSVQSTQPSDYLSTEAG